MTEEEQKNIFASNLADLLNMYADSSGKRGMTQQELANELNKRYSLKIRQATVSYWKSGDKIPRPIIIQQIGELFGKDAGWMLTQHYSRKIVDETNSQSTEYYEIESIEHFFKIAKDIKELSNNNNNKIIDSILTYDFRLKKYKTVTCSIELKANTFDRQYYKKHKLSIHIYIKTCHNAPEVYGMPWLDIKIDTNILNKEYAEFECLINNEINVALLDSCEAATKLQKILKKEKQQIDQNQFVEPLSVYDAYYFERGFKISEDGLDLMSLTETS